MPKVMVSSFREMLQKEVDPKTLELTAAIGKIVPLTREITPEQLEELKQGGTLTHVITDKTTDRDGDIIDPKGWDFENWLKNPVVLFGHKSRELPVGKGIDLKQMSTKVKATMEFPSEALYPFGNTVGRLAAAGYMNATSVGFIPRDYEPLDEDDPWGGYRFLSQELTEYSIVPVPSNPAALQVSYEGSDDSVKRQIRDDFDLVIEEIDSETASNAWKTVRDAVIKSCLVTVPEKGGGNQADNVIKIVTPEAPVIKII